MTTTPEGLLLVDKPAGWTSHDVVARIRRVCGTRRVGHAGTLDPMATGVLVLGVGRATKLLTFLVGCDKGYAATVRLGQSTVTDDAEGDVVASADASGGVARCPRRGRGSVDRCDRAGPVLGQRHQDRRTAVVCAGEVGRGGPAGRAAGDREPVRRPRRASERRPPRRRRGGRGVVGHLRPGPRPRPGRGARRRRPPHGAAPDPGRPVRDRRRGAPRGLWSPVGRCHWWRWGTRPGRSSSSTR